MGRGFGIAPVAPKVLESLAPNCIDTDLTILCFDLRSASEFVLYRGFDACFFRFFVSFRELVCSIV